MMPSMGVKYESGLSRYRSIVPPVNARHAGIWVAQVGIADEMHEESQHDEGHIITAIRKEADIAAARDKAEHKKTVVVNSVSSTHMSAFIL
jgi:hypothetical protein